MNLRQSLRSIYEIWAGSEGVPVPETAVEAYLMRLIEQMRGEASRALAEPEPEVAAWYDEQKDELTFNPAVWPDTYDVKTLYLSPPQREWVGLTDDEKHLFSSWLDDKMDFEVFEAIEAKLKEKNT